MLGCRGELMMNPIAGSNFFMTFDDVASGT